MENISRWNVARRYEGRALLIAINAVASLSIFFFGYDQGVMGGVNNNRDYAQVMGFGSYNPADKTVTVNHALLQGGIVSLSWALAKSSTNGKPDCSILSARDTVRQSLRRLVW